MIEIFKTNVQEPDAAVQLVNALLVSFPGNRINFDLHDCDHILRFEGAAVPAEKIIALLCARGYTAELL
jgi:hypothetical protein